MTTYLAPLADMRFVINELAGLDALQKLPGCGEATPELVDAILEEAGKLASDVIAPLNRVGDLQGCVLENGVVRTPEGFADAYAQFVAGGWNGVPFEPDHGGMGLPWLVSTAVFEIWHAANMAFALCPLLNQAACELLATHGSDDLKAVFLQKLVSGEWSGTMNLTEPQAGSDLSRVRAKAVNHGHHYHITGQKIFISWGEHDMAENIVHMVLARTSDAGIKGLSLFVVPKFLIGDDGGLGPRNDLRCVSIEHKLGIKASPTAVMSYGDDGGAIGYLVGEESRGIEYMFTMMNNARLAVGVEGLGVAERAYQHALAFAGERRQGRDAASGSNEPAPIVRHPDVRRMLLSMRAQIEAVRALAYFTAARLDAAKRHPDAARRKECQALVDLLIPVVKAWGSDVGIDVANTAIQIHGGAGVVEESGAPQYLRDVRVTAIYEGTNGIQAIDLVGRKVAREAGATANALIAAMREVADGLSAGKNADGKAIGRALAQGCDALADATDWIVANNDAMPDAVLAGAVPYLKLMAIVAGGWMMARAAAVAAGRDDDFAADKLVTARFYADQILVQAEALAATVTGGWDAVGRFRAADA
jgi:alkylation response protein AidB-like acyl-CoA dehydrogenase